jgi:hypothetical protein
VSRASRKLRRTIARDQLRDYRQERAADLPIWRQPTLGALIAKLKKSRSNQEKSQ